MTLYEKLYPLADGKYRDFSASLTPTVKKENIIGVRTPLLRNFAKEFFKSEEKDDFLSSLPHDFLEENHVHAFLIEQIKDYDECVERLNAFLPYVDNWATSDCCSPKVLSKYPEKYEKQIYLWLDSPYVYEVRFAVKQLMACFLDKNFKVEQAERLCKIKSDEYYINMVVAWYFATALAKRYDEILPFFENKKLPVWTHNKAIQKAVESFRVTEDHKEYLKTLKIK